MVHSMLAGLQEAPPPPAPAPHRNDSLQKGETSELVEAAIKDIRLTLQRTKALPLRSPPMPVTPGDEVKCGVDGGSPIWVPRYDPPTPTLQPLSNGRVSPPPPPTTRRHQPPPQPQTSPLVMHHPQQQQQPQRQINVTMPPVDLECKPPAGPSSDDAADEGMREDY